MRMLGSAIVFVILLLISGFAAAQSNIRILETKPEISGNNLEIEMIFMNDGVADGNVLFVAIYSDEPDSTVETIPAMSTRILRYHVLNVQPRIMKIGIFSDENRFMKINVPEDFRSGGTLGLSEISETEWYAPIGGAPGGRDENAATNFPFGIPFSIPISDNDLIRIAIIILGISAIVLSIKITFREKSAGEIEIESMEKMLAETKEIEEARRIAGIRRKALGRARRGRD